MNPTPAPDADPTTPWVDVVIEIPRGGWCKRDLRGEVDFVSPLPCPFNYGAVPAYIGLDHDLLDAVVLGPKVAFGTALRVRAVGAVGLLDRDIYDDKLICAATPPGRAQRAAIVAFFHLYAHAKSVLNAWRGASGTTRCLGWGAAARAIERAQPVA